MNLLFFVLPFTLLLVFYLLIKKDVLAPEVVIGMPLFVALSSYSLMLSTYYKIDVIGFLFILLCYSFLFFGFFLVPVTRYKSRDYISKLNSKIDIKKLSIVINFIMVMAVLTFLVESLVVTPPLLSNTPNKNYMSFGLPIIHHFISLLMINVVLTFIYMKCCGKSRKFWLNLSVCFVIFVLLTQRLSLLLILMIAFFCYLFFNNKFFTFKGAFFLVFPILAFLMLFVLVGEARLGDVGDEFIYGLTMVDKNIVPASLALPYIYISSGVQNTLNLMFDLPQYYYGYTALIKSLPLIDTKMFFEFDPVDYQILVNFTTFIFPKVFIMDFGYLAPLACFFFGIMVKLVYRGCLGGAVWSCLFFLSYVLPQGFFLFFSDNFINSSLFIYLFSILIIAKFIRPKRT